APILCRAPGGRERRGGAGFFYARSGGGTAMVIEAAAPTAAGERLLGSGLVLGAVAETSYEERAVRVGPGDVLVAYTDGVTETFPPEGQGVVDERRRRSGEADRHR